GGNHAARNKQPGAKNTGGEGPTPAVTEQHEIARIEPVFDRDPTDRPGHDHGGDRNYSVRHSDHAIASVVTERLSDVLLDGALSRFYVELHLTAEKIIRVQPSKN